MFPTMKITRATEVAALPSMSLDTACTLEYPVRECVCERERVRERECVCVREESVCVCVCE